MSREGFIHNGQIVYRVIYTMTTGEGIVVSLDRDGNDIRGARPEDPTRRIVTTKPGERIWALGQWWTVARAQTTVTDASGAGIASAAPSR